MRFIRGNADRIVVERGEFGGGLVRGELGEERLAAVATWPLDVELDVAGGTTFCHATPRPTRRS